MGLKGGREGKTGGGVVGLTVEMILESKEMSVERGGKIKLGEWEGLLH